MKISKILSAVTAAAVVLTLTACSDGETTSNPFDIFNSGSSSSSVISSGSSSSSSEKSSSSESLSSSSSEKSSSTSNKPEENKTPVEIKLDYYKYYDPISNRSTLIDSTGVNEPTLYMIDDNSCLNIITPFSSKSNKKIEELKKDRLNAYDRCFVLDNNVFYEYEIYWGSTGLKKYNIKTGEISVVVPSNNSDRRLFQGSFVLSNKNQIYGTIITRKQEPCQTEDGKMDIKEICQYNLVKINDGYDGYTIIKTFDENYEYSLEAVYNNIAYLSKKKPDKYVKPDFVGGTPSTISGENLGLFSYDIDKDIEEKVFNAYEFVSGSYSSNYSLIEIDGEPCFIYESEYGGKSHIKIYTQATGWKEIFSSGNQFLYTSGIQYLNGRLFVFLYPENDNNHLLCYEVTMNSSEYIGICEEWHNPIIISSNSGKVQYVDEYGNVKDFI